MSVRSVAIATLAVTLSSPLISTPSLVAQAPPPAPADAIQRPRPYPITPPRDFLKAITAGTRTRSGEPGPNYWQQHTTYTLHARLDPKNRQLSGRGKIEYTNHSPHTLDSVAVQLLQDMYKAGGIRNRPFSVTTGVTLTSVKADGVTLADKKGYRHFHTVIWVRLPKALAPGATTTLEFDWHFTIPTLPSPRMGTDGEVFFIAYWYPQMAVYDDVEGWQVDPYQSAGEFYMGYGDYDVSITLPEGWLVSATGTLQNPQDVLSQQTRNRLAQARTSDQVINIVTRDERKPGTSTAHSADGWLTWKYTARDVRDFAFGSSDLYVWDATHATVASEANPAGDSSLVEIHSLYRPDTVTWRESARYLRHSIEFLSKRLWPYPYPHMSATEGIAGGMEFPMITAVANSKDSLRLQGTTLHEVAHMWFPMQVGTDEKRYAWIDEGLTEYNEVFGTRDIFPAHPADTLAIAYYLDFVKKNEEVSSMRHSDEYPILSLARVSASYYKPATVYIMTEGVVGREKFLEALRVFGKNWRYKHPQPYDFWNTVNTVTRTNLDWFWRTWFYETWTLDQAIGAVTTVGDSLRVRIEDRGQAPMPVQLAITRRDGTVERMEIPVTLWLEGATFTEIMVGNAATVARIEIDPERAFADVDRSNQVWVAP